MVMSAQQIRRRQAPERFDSVIVADDLSGVAHRALPVIGRLARRGNLAVRLVTTTSPGLDPANDRRELEIHARKLHGCHVTPIVLESNDPADDLADFAERHPGGLVCVASRGRGQLAEFVSGSMTDELLRRHRGPLLIVGPEVPHNQEIGERLLVCVDELAFASDLLSVAAAWRRTFGGTVELVHTDAEDVAEAIVTVATETKSIIAVASHLRPRVERMVRGSVTWDAVRSAATPVLVVPS